MRVLYAIFVVSVGVLVWAAIAAARHIRQHEAGKPQDARPAPPEETWAVHPRHRD